MMTVSAAVRLIPSPPALVHSRNTNLSESEESGMSARSEGDTHARSGPNLALRICRWLLDEVYL